MDNLAIHKCIKMDGQPKGSF